jgi:predicted AAA+ superfamily ATPase
MIPRNAQQTLDQLGQIFPVIAITGPRQSGKTTLAQTLYPQYEYFNLENPATLAMIESDPHDFIRRHSTQVIFDEVQRFPPLLSYIQVITDEQPHKAQFILSGSQNLLLSEKISQTLAGRAAYFTLYPLSIAELQSAQLLQSDPLAQIITGFYPAIYKNHLNLEQIGLYFGDYIATYVERDVKQIKNIAHLSSFRKFLGLLSGRTGQLVDKVSLGNDVGVSATTIESWLSILEASYLILRLPPYWENLGKRLIKSPKIYWTDTGLLSNLLGIDTVAKLSTHYLRGGLFENLVIMELKKQLVNRKSSANLYFLRGSNDDSREVDIIIDSGTDQKLVEIKAGSSFSSSFLTGINYWAPTFGANRQTKISGKYVIYTGSSFHAQGVEILNWQDISRVLA